MNPCPTRRGTDTSFVFGGAYWLVICGFLIALPTLCRGADFLEGFDGPKTTWKAIYDERACRIVDHRRHAQIRRFGTGAERIVVTADRITSLSLLHRVSPARALDELTASVWIRSNRSGGKLMVRVIFPHLVDPATNAPVERWLDGNAYEGENKWQLLKCQTLEKELRRRMQLLRATLGSDVNLSDPYVDRVQFLCELGEGTTEFYIDELKLGPVVSPDQTFETPEQETLQTRKVPRVTLQHDRLMWDGRPLFPTILPYHGEPASELSDLGIKMVWIPRYDDHELIQSLTKSGLGIIATPPLALSDEGEVLDAENAGLAPMDEATDPILMWMLGTYVAAEERTRLASWQKQLMSADRRLNRPLAADVIGDERAFSRLVPVLGISRTVQQTSLDFGRYRDWLADRHLAARPGSFLWTWVETEPPHFDAPGSSAAIRTLEPEQIRMQVYAALSSGVRGLGFWPRHGLFHDLPGAAESRLMLKQVHFELELLEPWLATATPVGQAKVELGFQGNLPNSRTSLRGTTSSGLAATPIGSLVSPGNSTNRSESQANRVVALSGHSQDQKSRKYNAASNRPVPIEATLLQSEYGTLLLGTWSDSYAQYVPGQMAAHDVSFLVSGIKETAKAWLITTTEIRPLATDRNTVPGGTLIRLPQFELTTAIIISSDLTLGEQLRHQMKAMQAESAMCVVQLSRAKLKRVTAVIDELQDLGRLQPDADRMLGKARQLSDKAMLCIEQKDYALAREMADSALQMLRILQRAHWDDAITTLTSPASSAHAVCFQTLPEHWRWQAESQTSRLRTTVNLLPSGDFEDAAELQRSPEDRWEHRQADLPQIAATAELTDSAPRRGQCLRLAATMLEGRPAPLVLPKPPVTVVTPPILLPSRGWIRIEGYVKVGRPFLGTREGFQIHDSQGGESLALHITDPCEWQRFEMHREVTSKQPLRLTFTLHGLGEVWIDDLAVYAHTPAGAEPRVSTRSRP